LKSCLTNRCFEGLKGKAIERRLSSIEIMFYQKNSLGLKGKAIEAD